MSAKEPKLDTRAAARPALWWRAAALLLVLLISGVVFLYRERLADFASYGYLGIFIVSVVGNATVLLPLPSLVATFVTGGVFNPIVVGLVSGAGMAIGELSGYLAGYGGRAIIDAESQGRYVRLEHWMRRYGGLTIFILSVVPNPIFDLAGIAAGALHYPLWRFLLFCFLGKTVKGVALALAGARSVEWLDRLLK